MRGAHATPSVLAPASAPPFVAAVRVWRSAASALLLVCLAGLPVWDAGGARAQALPAAQPDYLVPSSDPALGSLITRITNDSGTPTSPVPGTWGGDARHTYSRQQPWSSDGALLMLENRNGGTPTRLFLDGADYTPRFGPCPGAPLFDCRWHPSRNHPHELINVDAAGTMLSWFDVAACSTTRAWTLPIAVQYGIGSGEGNPSNDGRFVALGNDTAMFVVDMDPQPPYAPYPNARLGPVYHFPPCSLGTSAPGACALGNLSISASGRYVDVKYIGSEDSTEEAHRIFEVDPVTLALSPHPMAAEALRCGSFAWHPDGWIYPLKHADLALDPFDGDGDVLVGGRACPGSDLGRVLKVRLSDGAVTALTDPVNEAAVSHVSTRNIDRPGWAYVSYFRDGEHKFSDEIVAVKLDGSGAVERYAHSHTVTTGCYRCEAHPVPSRDGRRVLFASNWAADCSNGCDSPADVKDYVAWLSDALPPERPRVSLDGVFPHPAPALTHVVFSLVDNSPATLELVDLAGRRVLVRALGSPGPGRHVTSLAAAPRLTPGVYWLHVRQSGHDGAGPVVIVR